MADLLLDQELDAPSDVIGHDKELISFHISEDHYTLFLSNKEHYCPCKGQFRLHLVTKPSNSLWNVHTSQIFVDEFI